jgi:hypothetical protein
MEEFNQMKSDVITQVSNIAYLNGDISDIGNEIGLALGKYIDANKDGYSIEDLITGIRHGVSLIDGTHF